MEIHEVAVIPLIIGVTELLKQIGLPTKFGSLASAVIGLLIGVLYISPEDIAKGVLVGLSLGLAASGLYYGAKDTVEVARSTINKAVKK